MLLLALVPVVKKSPIVQPQRCWKTIELRLQTQRDSHFHVAVVIFFFLEIVTAPTYYSLFNTAVKHIHALIYSVLEKNSCRPNPCKNDGQCVETISNYKCYCRSGFTGKHCEGNL